MHAFFASSLLCCKRPELVFLGRFYNLGRAFFLLTPPFFFFFPSCLHCKKHRPSLCSVYVCSFFFPSATKRDYSQRIPSFCMPLGSKPTTYPPPLFYLKISKVRGRVFQRLAPQPRVSGPCFVENELEQAMPFPFPQIFCIDLAALHNYLYIGPAGCLSVFCGPPCVPPVHFRGAVLCRWMI